MKATKPKRKPLSLFDFSLKRSHPTKENCYRVEMGELRLWFEVGTLVAFQTATMTRPLVCRDHEVPVDSSAVWVDGGAYRAITKRVSLSRFVEAVRSLCSGLPPRIFQG